MSMRTAFAARTNGAADRSANRLTPRKAHKIAVRRHRDGSGPTVGDAPPARFPGAVGAFSLLGEVGMIGLLIVLVAIPVVTLPAGLAVGIRHLRRYVEAEDSRVRWFWRDFRAAAPTGSLLGAGAAIVAAVLAADIVVAQSGGRVGGLPGGEAIAAIGWVGLAVTAVAVLCAASRWTPALGWRGALRAVPSALRDDIGGAVYLLAAVALVVVLTWMLPPLIVPAIGCAALAAVAIPQRPRRRRVSARR